MYQTTEMDEIDCVTTQYPAIQSANLRVRRVALSRKTNWLAHPDSSPNFNVGTLTPSIDFLCKHGLSYNDRRFTQRRVAQIRLDHTMTSKIGGRAPRNATSSSGAQCRRRHRLVCPNQPAFLPRRPLFPTFLMSY
jgi:hypothetical protein